MKILWARGESAVGELVAAMPDGAALAYNSVLTTIRILEKKGYVRHIKDGRAYIYRALVEREEASRSEIRHLAHRFFQNSHEMLVLNILEDRGVDSEELNRLRQLLEQTQPDGDK